MPSSILTPGRTPGRPARWLGVWAHPDDEAYLSAGAMDRTVRAGGRVSLVALTDGEAGFAPDDPRPAPERRRLRRAELGAAMATIGVHDLHLLGAPDGGLPEADPQPLEDALVAVIRTVRPDVVLTFGPDGITGHPDHIVTGRLATRAWHRAGLGELRYAAKTQAWLDGWRDLHDRYGVWMTGEPTGVPAGEVGLVVDLDGDELARKRRVLSAHASQTGPLAQAMGEQTYRDWVRQETFRRPTLSEIASAVRDLRPAGRIGALR